MNTLIIILIFAIVSLLLIYFLKVNIKIDVQQTNKDFDAKITIQTIARFIRYTIDVPAIDLDEESPSVVFKEDKKGIGTEKHDKKKFSVNELIKSISKIQEFLKETIGFYKILNSFLSKSELSKFEWNTELGLEDAAKTGTSCGFVWMVKGSFVGLLANHMQMVDKPKINVNPRFQDLFIATRFKCMVSFRIGYAIHTGLKILRHRKKSTRKKKININD